MDSLWNSPVEQFRWNGSPMELPVVIQIRDREKRPLFYIGLNTREYQKVEKFEKEIVPKIIELMNNYSVAREMAKHPELVKMGNEALDAILNKAQAIVAIAPQTNGNGHSNDVQPKRRGMPKGGWPSMKSKKPE